jgi:hypothetical protein
MGIGVEPSGAAAPAVELSPLHPSETLLRQINYKIPRICSLLRYGYVTCLICLYACFFCLPHYFVWVPYDPVTYFNQLFRLVIMRSKAKSRVILNSEGLTSQAKLLSSQ